MEENNRLRIGTVFGDDVLVKTTKFKGCLGVTLQKKRDVFSVWRAVVMSIGTVFLGVTAKMQVPLYGAIALGVLVFYWLFQALFVVMQGIQVVSTDNWKNKSQKILQKKC